MSERFSVTDEQYRVIDRRIADIKRKLNQKAGSPLDPLQVAYVLQRISEGDIRGLLGKADVPSDKLVHGLYTCIDIQVHMVERASQEHGWGFTEEDFQRAHDSAPDWPEDPLTAVVLVPYFETTEKTFVHLWELGRARYEGFYQWDGYNNVLTDNVIRLLAGIEHPGKCLRWEIIDFGANRGKASNAVRDPKTSPHAGVLASVWLHPNWVKFMDGDTVPYVWASGYQVNVPGRDAWRHVPCVWFDRHDREVRLHYDWDGDEYGNYSVPVFVRE